MLPWTELTPDAFADLIAGWGHPPSHARNLLRTFYNQAGRVELTYREFGKQLLAKLETETVQRQSRVLHDARSADGTRRLLVGLDRGGAVETVLMPSHKPDRAAGCVSSQIGCAMGCDFCASTRAGLQRSLSAGEIVEQFLHLKEVAAAEGRRIVTLVFMGQGEPMHNLDNVMNAIRRIAGPDLGAIGWRHVTVSTVGVVPGIDRLAASDLGVHLAVSLHAPDDETRSKIVPSNRRYPVKEVMDATRRFYDRTSRIPTIEYCLLDGVNDSDAQAELLADLVGTSRFHVNLIPYNAIGQGVSGVEYRRPPQERMDRFLTILRDRRIVAHFRTTRGDDVNAACGQLRETLVGLGAR
jgi:23S rRNA (adenine2503-C2)-methyltransferase